MNTQKPDSIYFFGTCLVDAVDQCVFGIALIEIELMSVGQVAQPGFDRFEGVAPIKPWLARTQQVQVGAVQHKNARHLRVSSSFAASAASCAAFAVNCAEMAKTCP